MSWGMRSSLQSVWSDLSHLLNKQTKNICALWTHLWSGTADLTDVTVMDLGGFGRLLGSKLFTLKGGFLGECVARPRRRCSYSCHSLLLLLLLLVVAGGCWVNCCFIARVWSSWEGSMKGYLKPTHTHFIFVSHFISQVRWVGGTFSCRGSWYQNIMKQDPSSFNQ